MALLEIVTMEVGAAIAKSIIKLWLKDSTLDDVSSSIVDLLKSHTSDVLAQRRGQRQFETIGEKIAENLLPLFQMEGIRLKENSRTAVAQAVATALNKSRFTSQLLVEHNLEPTKLAKHIWTLTLPQRNSLILLRQHSMNALLTKRVHIL